MRTNTCMLMCVYVYIHMLTQAYTHMCRHTHSMHTHMHTFAFYKE